MSNMIDLKIRSLDGSTLQICIPQTATVKTLQTVIQQKDRSCLPYLQRLILEREEMEEDRTLSSYQAMKSGTIIHLLRLPPWELYVTDMRGVQHVVAIPSKKPKEYTVSELRSLLEEKTAQKLDGYHIIFKGVALIETRNGRSTTLASHGIDKEDTIIIGKMSCKIRNPTIDLCFMVDCTGSMGSWIEGVKNNVKQLRDKLEAEFSSCDIQFAFVCYTDYDMSPENRITFLDFTKDQASFHEFVGAICASGGGDTPEDIMGALKVTFSSLGWRQNVIKVLIHIADAPCHGKMYHSCDDTYPDGDPSGICHEQIMKLVATNDVQYWFGYINKELTEKMVSIFGESLRSSSDQRLTIRQVDATNSAQLSNAFYKSVCGSIFASEAAKTASICSYTINQTIPDWRLLPVIQGMKTPPVAMLGINGLLKGVDIKEPSVHVSIKCAPDPFEEGEECIAFYGYDVTNCRRIVLKQFKRIGREYNDFRCYMRILLVNTISTAYANEFNGEKARPSVTLSLVPTDIVKYVKNGQDCFFICQMFVDGKFEKFNSNNGLVFSISQLSEPVQAFSHYTYKMSQKSLLVCDLQGVASDTAVQLTDLAIHSNTEKGNEFGPTDLGYGGIEQFFKTHRCGGTCRLLGL